MLVLRCTIVIVGMNFKGILYQMAITIAPTTILKVCCNIHVTLFIIKTHPYPMLMRGRGRREITFYSL
jgi:hypothetical protein